MFQVRLKVLGGKYDGRIIALKGKRFLVGREQDCHLRPNSEQISRHHCAFSMDDYSVRLKDLGSTNGTFVDGERVEGDRVLSDGDVVSFGDLKFRVLIQEVSPEQAAAPAVGDSQLLSAKDLASDPAASDGDTREIKIDQALTAPTPTEPTPTEPTPAEPAPAATAQQPAVPQQPPQPEPPMQPVPAGPPQYPGYQMPQYPGYPQQNWYYPQMPWGYQGMPQPAYPQPYPQQPYPQQFYPQQPYPQQGYPGQYGGPQPESQQPQQPQQPAPSQEPTAEDLGITLPDPATTGAKDEPKPAGDQSAGQSTEKNPSQMAAELLKNRHRRG